MSYSQRKTDRLLTRAEVCERLRISRTTLWRYVKAELLPDGIEINFRGDKAWREEDIRAFERSRDSGCLGLSVKEREKAERSER